MDKSTLFSSPVLLLFFSSSSSLSHITRLTSRCRGSRILPTISSSRLSHGIINSNRLHFLQPTHPRGQETPRSSTETKLHGPTLASTRHTRHWGTKPTSILEVTRE